jgi:hypothetical protein
MPCAARRKPRRIGVAVAGRERILWTVVHAIVAGSLQFRGARALGGSAPAEDLTARQNHVGGLQIAMNDAERVGDRRLPVML